MRRQVVLLSFLFALMAVMADDYVEEVRKLDPFNKVIAAHGINVKLIYNDLEEANVKVKGIALEDVVTEVDNMTLKVRVKATIKSDITVLVEVSYKQVKEVEANTGAYIETVRPLWGESLKLYAITGGVIKAESEAKSVNAITSGVSVIEVYGKADYLSATANIGGEIKCFSLTSKKVEATSRSGSKIQVFVTEEIDAKSSMGATIEIKGAPEIKNFKTSLGGEIKEVDTKPEYGKDLIRDVK